MAIAIYVAAVLDDFDLVAVQEVMTREVGDRLTDLARTHEVLLTDTPTPETGPYREYFAFFYRPEVLVPVSNAYAPDPDDRLFRDPYVACFRLRASGETLCLVTVHLRPTKPTVAVTKAEVEALGEALTWAQNFHDTTWWVVLGDFNRAVDDRSDRDLDPEPEWRALTHAHAHRAPVALAGEEVPTTLGARRYVKRYDHVFVSLALAPRLRRSARYDLVHDACAGDFDVCQREVSDHAPVYVELDLCER